MSQNSCWDLQSLRDEQYEHRIRITFISNSHQNIFKINGYKQLFLFQWESLNVRLNFRNRHSRLSMVSKHKQQFEQLFSKVKKCMGKKPLKCSAEYFANKLSLQVKMIKFLVLWLAIKIYLNFKIHWNCGTLQYEMMVFSQRLDLILEVFSNLNSMILRGT